MVDHRARSPLCFKAPAAKLFTEHLKTNPKHFDSWMFRGWSYDVLGSTNEAVSDYAMAEKHGSPCEKLIAQGMSLQAQKKFSDATALFEEATIAYPNDAIGWHHYGFMISCDDQDEAIFALRKAISLNYRYSGLTHYYLGKLLVSKGENVKAIANFMEGVRLNPTCTSNHIELGSALLAAGFLQEAEDYLLKALELNDNLTEANFLLAMLYYRKGDFKEYIRSILMCLKLREINLFVPTTLILYPNIPPIFSCPLHFF